MTKEEFLSLPPAVALRVLYDAIDDDAIKALDQMEPPKLPRSPKYDRAIYRSGGHQYASETSLEGLRYWCKRALESAAGGGQYADKDRKQADELQKWIAWRECFPGQPWSGERGDRSVIAQPPTDKPTIHQRQQSARKPAAPAEDDTSFDPETF